VEELHASIAAYLRAQRQRDKAAQLSRVESAILAIWYERSGVPHCRYCGKPIEAGDDIWDVEYLRQARACGDHYAPF